MTLSESDKEFINAIQTAHYAKLDATLTILTNKIDLHIEREDKKEEEIKKIKCDIFTLQTESSNHKYMRKWQYAAMVIIGILIAAITNLSKIGF